MTNLLCKTLTIFEGPDGGGKTTLAMKYAKANGAKYVHFPSLPNVHTSLGRMYVEAMLPALEGYQDVVFDRSWLSERIYGYAFREGADRLGIASIRMLERLAMRCGAIVINCLPPYETVLETFKDRKHLEMLDDDYQLKEVHATYGDLDSSLCTLYHDRTINHVDDVIDPITNHSRLHSIVFRTAGNLDATVAIVGDVFGSIKNEDSFYQWPFASFSNKGCSQWLTFKLHNAGISEHELLWVNSEGLEVFDFLMGKKIYALGDRAYDRLKNVGGLNVQKFNHPQYQKRFAHSQSYDLITDLKFTLGKI